MPDIWEKTEIWVLSTYQWKLKAELDDITQGDGSSDDRGEGQGPVVGPKTLQQLRDRAEEEPERFTFTRVQDLQCVSSELCITHFSPFMLFH
jgi:hypothetical protein